MGKTSSLIAFMLGMAVGSAATWQILKNRYARQAEEEIASVKAFYQSKQESRTQEPNDTPQEAADRALHKPSVAEYAKLLRQRGYTNYSDGSEAEEKPEQEEERPADEPYVISPDDFGDQSDYDKISLVYFADGVLADEDNDPLDDPEEIVGDALEHFGEYDNNAVYVRNDGKKCDYEVLRDLRRFSDLLEDRR